MGNVKPDNSAFPADNNTSEGRSSTLGIYIRTDRKTGLVGRLRWTHSLHSLCKRFIHFVHSADNLRAPGDGVEARTLVVVCCGARRWVAAGGGTVPR